jgi:hypoxia up-regulated 1
LPLASLISVGAFPCAPDTPPPYGLIVTNFQSKRRTPNNIAFYQGERLYGSDAYALMARKPEIVFSKFFRMIGKSENNPRLSELKNQYFSNPILTNESTSLVTLPVGETAYTPEEFLAMMMTHIKDMSKEYIGTSAKDCVLTVPASFTQHERHAIQTAAEIAELNVLTLIEENTAAALHFGIDRVFDTPHNVLFFNMGSGSVQVSIVTFSSFQAKDGSKNKTTGQFHVVGKAWDEELGGFNFDLVLADLLASRFNANWQKKKSGAGQDVRNFPRAMTRLRMDALKIREILSANNEYPYKVEQLHADVDLSTKVSEAIPRSSPPRRSQARSGHQSGV